MNRTVYIQWLIEHLTANL